MLDGLTCVYKSSVDLFFYVMGSANENGVIIGVFVTFSANSLLANLTSLCHFLVDTSECADLFLRCGLSDFKKERRETLFDGQSGRDHLGIGRDLR